MKAFYKTFFLSDTMKFLIFFTLAFATVTSKDLYPRLIEDPVLENEGRIVNGQKADPAQFKYMVGLALTKGSMSFWCGASLIGEKWVLTAAHCTNAVSSITVLLGATVRKCPEKFYNVSNRDVFIHPHFVRNGNLNDMSLIKIPATNESTRIGFVKIPDNNDGDYLNRSVVAVGWGKTSDNATDLSDDLNYGILKVSPGEICVERYGAIFNNLLRICVATPNRVSTCLGDSGGPLVLEGENIQIGVTSIGGKGCTRKEPIVFARVSAYRFWIALRMRVSS